VLVLYGVSWFICSKEQLKTNRQNEHRQQLRTSHDSDLLDRMKDGGHERSNLVFALGGRGSGEDIRTQYASSSD
jgi:hypothetical protein